MPEAAIPERATLGAREAMPMRSFLDQVEGMSLDNLDAAAGQAGRVADADRQQAAALWAEICRVYPDAIEWLLDQTLRRPNTLPHHATIETVALAATAREGENRVVWWILQAIANGRKEPPPYREGV